MEVPPPAKAPPAEAPADAPAAPPAEAPADAPAEAAAGAAAEGENFDSTVAERLRPRLTEEEKAAAKAEKEKQKQEAALLELPKTPTPDLKALVVAGICKPAKDCLCVRWKCAPPPSSPARLASSARHPERCALSHESHPVSFAQHPLLLRPCPQGQAGHRGPPPGRVRPLQGGVLPDSVALLQDGPQPPQEGVRRRPQARLQRLEARIAVYNARVTRCAAVGCACWDGV